MRRPASAAVGRSWLGLLGHLLTVSRLASSPLIFGWIVEGRAELAAGAAAIAMLTDWVDGPLVRRFGCPSRAGAWFDVWADLLVIVAAFAGFAAAGILSFWPLILIGASFLVFVATSGVRPTMYDPVGRYIGGILMAAALVVLLAQDFVIQRSVEWTVVIACLATMAARLAHVLPAQRQGAA